MGLSNESVALRDPSLHSKLLGSSDGYYWVIEQMRTQGYIEIDIELLSLINGINYISSAINQ
jgi:hypothetical protein